MIFSGWLFLSFAALLVANVSASARISGAEFRLALLRSVVMWSASLAIGTELLGAGRWITPLGVSFWWMIVTGVSLAFAATLCWKRRGVAGLRPRSILGACLGVLRDVTACVRGMRGSVAALWIFLTLWFGSRFAVAL